jgi:hypothetical protein
MKKIIIVITVLFCSLFAGCAWIPVRPALKEDITIPPGKTDGNQFTGVRYPFKVSAPPHWKVTTEFPDLLEELGYDRPFSTDQEQTELYVLNPETKTNITFDLTPAGRYARFNQGQIEWATSLAAESMVAELDKEFGKGVVKPDFFPTEPYSLKGVKYAAKKYATYKARGEKWEQGWIYGFAEPYQIFIIYLIKESGDANDRQDMKKVIDSFEFIKK